MNNIIISKYLFKKAETSWQLSDPFSNGITVSLLQDSAEMLIWEMVKHLNVKLKSKEGFVSLIEEIDSKHGGIYLKAQILEVNNSRVNFKHYGNIPSSLDIPKFIDNTRGFLESNAKKIGYDYKKCSLADVITNEHVKNLIKNAETLLIKDDIDEAFIIISTAYSKIEQDAEKSIFEKKPDIRDAWELFPKDTQDKARNLFNDMSYFIDDFTWLSSVMGLGYSKKQVIDIRDRCAIVNISVSGNRIGVHSRGKKSVATRENVEYLIRNVTDMAMSLYS